MSPKDLKTKLIFLMFNILHDKCFNHECNRENWFQKNMIYTKQSIVNMMSRRCSPNMMMSMTTHHHLSEEITRCLARGEGH